MSNDNTRRLRTPVTPEIVEAAIRRGRYERSVAFWAVLEAIFGRPEQRDAGVRAAPERARNLALSR
jgi:hypothetical protein